MSIKEIRDVYDDWKKANGTRTVLKPKELVERLRGVCDKRSTDKEFWGIRLKEEEEEESLLGPA
jgi:hypothetical protein